MSEREFSAVVSMVEGWRSCASEEAAVFTEARNLYTD